MSDLLVFVFIVLALLIGFTLGRIGDKKNAMD